MTTANGGNSSPAALLGEARNELAHADQKASMILAALGVGAGATLAGFIASDWSPAKLVGGARVSWWSAAALALLAVYFSASAVWPRTKHQQPAGPVMFWGQAAEFESGQALKDHWASHPVSAEDRSIDQLWHVSRLLRTKYSNIRRALVTSGVSIMLFLITGITML